MAITRSLSRLRTRSGSQWAESTWSRTSAFVFTVHRAREGEEHKEGEREGGRKGERREGTQGGREREEGGVTLVGLVQSELPTFVDILSSRSTASAEGDR